MVGYYVLYNDNIYRSYIFLIYSDNSRFYSKSFCKLVNVTDSQLNSRYDGDVEMKTKTEQSRDLLLYREDVEPVENRLRVFTLGAGAAFIASCVSYNIILKDKPLFNQYDADMLERLQYDDKVSKMSQQQNDGRPTYCDSRYYRAIANGGQGKLKRVIKLTLSQY